ncbi:hypothetical protein T05_5490 [Trichinella murrelli]|uniref:Uncharacterized protein n=1 Tax=Trichinella murrelli TaxID=144512 RepID=A0A0V0T773_9BILA|nr:hypothetical protein T05_5490 [Trichinella murrelli]
MGTWSFPVSSVALATLPVSYPYYPAVPPPLFPTTTMSIQGESYTLTTKGV